MNEYHVGFLACGGLFGVVISCILYMMGGRNNKIIRRLGGAAVLRLTVNLLSLAMGLWSPWMLLTLPLLFGAFSLGYGAETMSIKIIRRTVYAAGVCTSGVLMAFILGGNAWWVLPFHVAIGMGSVYLGVRNPVRAAAEEVFICAILNIGLIMYPFIGTS